MKALLIYFLQLLAIVNIVSAQHECATVSSKQENTPPGINLSSASSSPPNGPAGRYGTEAPAPVIVKIPVVVHVLYRLPTEKISDAVIHQQIDLLNNCFRKRNTDTANIPAAFKPLAADCEIEFVLATSTPAFKNTTGIKKKYTPVSKWKNDDKMKFSAEMGSDAWDTKSYLNIWVCNLDKYAGYSSLVGDDEKVDGIVLSFSAFTGSSKAIVHETGHWMNLRHLWGDAYCGDDGVEDTPQQAGANSGCPSGVRLSCGTNPSGDMYNNYMDFTNQACINMFSLDQKARMRALLLPDGARYLLLSSKGLNPPLYYESPIPEEDPTWLGPRIFPNPALNELTIDLNYDARWIGKTLKIINLQGQVVIQQTISSQLLKINLTKLPSGTYFIAAKREDGLSLKQQFIKL